MKNISEQLIEEFLIEYRNSGLYLSDRIARIAELVIAPGETAQSASSALFTRFVEPLADSFQTSAVTVYNRVLAQVIQACRKDAQAADLDRELVGCGLTSEEDLVVRAERLRLAYRLINLGYSNQHIKRVIILSRITIGADIAVTSLVMDRMKREFQCAELVLVGGAKAIELLLGDSRVRFELKLLTVSNHKQGSRLAHRYSFYLEAVRESRRVGWSRPFEYQWTSGCSGPLDRLAAWLRSDERLESFAILGEIGTQFPRNRVCSSSAN
jgi:hypothetical protein